MRGGRLCSGRIQVYLHKYCFGILISAQHMAKKKEEEEEEDVVVPI